MFIDIHTHHKRNSAAELSLLNLYPSAENWSFDAQSLYSVGLHPYYLRPIDAQKDWDWLVEYAHKKNILAIGECGLDKEIPIDLAYQTLIFEKQIDLAISLEKPIILHIVRAFGELIAIKKRLQPSVPMIIHGFNKKVNLANDLIRHNFYLSYGYAISYSPTAKESLAQTPLDRLFLETDNTDVSIETVYKEAAVIKNIPIQKLKNQIAENFAFVTGFQAV